MFDRIAKPGIVTRWINLTALPVLTVFLFLTAAGIYQAFFVSPPDYQQGESVRIMYVHVPSAWMALLAFMIIGTSSAAFLIWRNPLYAATALASAPAGAAFSLITLVSGSIWGRPIWGTWWVWDARLTSVLILFFLYLGYIALAGAFERPERGLKSASILAVAGLVNLPVIKFSVEWWNTLHQPASILRASGPSIDSSMLIPLSLMFGSFLCYFLLILSIRLKTHLLEKKIERLNQEFS